MAAPKTRPRSVERALHLEHVQDLLKRGNTTTAIAKATDRSPATISRDKGVILGQWRQEMVLDEDKHKVVVLKQTEMVLCEAWEAFHRHENGADPRYLRIVLEAIKRKCAILGLDAPKGVKAEVRTQSMEIGIEETMAMLQEVVGTRI